jgi:glyoxylase-like metal-dependent hydrolase (beta-lactamase superfamily II)
MTSFFRSFGARWPIALVLGGALGAPQFGHGVHAQQRAAAPAAGTLETIQIRSNVYVIFANDSNVTAHVGEDGVILVDSGPAATADKVVQAIKAITNQPIRLILNTSADPDHVGGNEKVAAAGVQLNPDSFADAPQATILAHENVMLRMSSGEPPAESGALPTETFTARHRSMYLNDDAVQVLRQTGAVSDGDSIVHFRRADVIAVGDIIDLRRFPRIDPARGGSIQGELEALNRLLELTVPAMPLVLKPGPHAARPGPWAGGRLRRARRVPRYGDDDQGHHRRSDQEGHDAAASEGGEPDCRLPETLGRGVWAVDDGHVR